MTVWQLLRAGGVTMYVLIACSVVSVAIIVERLIFFKVKSKIKRREFMAEIKKLLDKKDQAGARELCRRANTPYACVALAGLNMWGHDEKVVSNNMEREIVVETTVLEKRTAFVGTIGSIAVYIGLFGTVLGIIRAFHDIASTATGGISVVINGIAEALVCTAAGLCVAVPAVVAYNFFTKRIDDFIKDMELTASEIMDLLSGAAK